MTASVVSLEEFMADPEAVMADAEGKAIAVLKDRQPLFYAVPAALYEELMDQLDDVELAELVAERSNDSSVAVNLSDL